MGEDTGDSLSETIAARAREGGFMKVELNSGETYRPYLIGDYELDEPEWRGDTGYFFARAELSEMKEPEGLDEDQYPTQLASIRAEITNEGWGEIKLAVEVQRVEDGDLKRWESVPLGEMKSAEVVEEAEDEE